MHELTTPAVGQFDYLFQVSRLARMSRACFEAATVLRLIQPILVLASASIVVILSTFSPAFAQTGGPIISGSNPNAPITGIQNRVACVWLLIAAESAESDGRSLTVCAGNLGVLNSSLVLPALASAALSRCGTNTRTETT